jgi:hypothetical protein
MEWLDSEEANNLPFDDYTSAGYWISDGETLSIMETFLLLKL